MGHNGVYWANDDTMHGWKSKQSLSNSFPNIIDFCDRTVALTLRSLASVCPSPASERGARGEGKLLIQPIQAHGDLVAGIVPAAIAPKVGAVVPCDAAPCGAAVAGACGAVNWLPGMSNPTNCQRPPG